jgi:predicted transcriptional regulator
MSDIKIIERMKKAEYPIFKENPFVESAVSHVVRNQKSHTERFFGSTTEWINQQTGAPAHLVMGVKKQIDTDAFTKVYHKSINEVLGIPERASVLLMYIATRLHMNKMEVDFDMADAMESLNKKHTAIYRALNDLLHFGILARTSKHYVYFINPKYIFNGNRFTIVREFVRKNGMDEQVEDTPQMMIENGDPSGYKWMPAVIEEIEICKETDEWS